jgi:hypothetical protein
MAIVVACASYALVPADNAATASRLALLAVLVALGITVYFSLLQLFGVAKLKELAKAVRHGT